MPQQWAQSVSHQTMSANDMAMISAAEKFSSLASRFAAIFWTAGSKLVVAHQAKIAGLQAGVVLEGQALQVLYADLGEAGK